MARQGWRKWGQVKKIKKKKRERAMWAQPMTVGKWEANCSIHISPSPSPPTNTISYHHLQVVITRAHMALSWPHPLLTRQHQRLSFSLHEAHADMVIPRWYDDGEMCACFAFFQPLPCFVCLWFGFSPSHAFFIGTPRLSPFLLHANSLLSHALSMSFFFFVFLFFNMGPRQIRRSRFYPYYNFKNIQLTHIHYSFK